MSEQDKWLLGNTRITITGLKEGSEGIIAELQPVAGGTVFQVFGYKNKSISIECLVVGITDKDALLAMPVTGDPVTLSGYGVDYGDFYIKSANVNWTTTYRQTFRTDVSPTDLVFKMTLDIMKE